MRTPERITLLGYDGTGEPPALADIWRQVIPEAKAMVPGFNVACLDRDNVPTDDPDYPHRKWCVDRIMERLQVWYIVKEHNDAVPHLVCYAQLDRDATTAVARVATLYDDMNKNTTINWLASHHRLILATLEARRLLTERADLARQINDQTGAVAKINKADSLTRTYYDAHVPADQQLQFPDPDRAQLDLADFIEQATERFRILRATLTGAYPPGFEPAPIDAGAAAEQVAAEWDGQPVPTGPGLAYADDAMRIPGPRHGDPHAHARDW